MASQSRWISSKSRTRRRSTFLSSIESLTDYHHLHPVAGDKPGEYRFDFAPKLGGTYHIWADLVPKATGKQEYSKTTVKVEGPPGTTE